MMNEITREMNVPTRVQRKRVKGWKQPPLTRYCGRPTLHGNFYRVGDIDLEIGQPMTREDTLRHFRGTCQSMISLNGREWFVDYYLRPLAEYRHLSCYCPLDVDCHVDVWIEYLKKYEVTA